MAVLRMFAMAREAAGTPTAVVDAPTVGELLAVASDRYGARFAAVVAISRVWVNGEPAATDVAVDAGDEVAIIPPVSGG